MVIGIGSVPLYLLLMGRLDWTAEMDPHSQHDALRPGVQLQRDVLFLTGWLYQHDCMTVYIYLDQRRSCDTNVIRRYLSWVSSNGGHDDGTSVREGVLVLAVTLNVSNSAVVLHWVDREDKRCTCHVYNMVGDVWGWGWGNDRWMEHGYRPEISVVTEPCRQSPRWTTRSAHDDRQIGSWSFHLQAELIEN